LTFGVEPNKIPIFKESIFELFEKYTLSKETGLVLLYGIGVDKELRNYSHKVKSSMVSLEEAIDFSKRLKNLEVLMDNWGLIGAIAALGYSEDPTEAVKI
jgi:tRNA(Ile2) C34 agmatinyltransferase TiaS